jgi:transcriptional regulator with XRE-family HTH domain
VTEQRRSTFQRRKLGNKLRRMRERAKMTLDDAAAKLEKSRCTLHRIERGEIKADVHLIRSMMDVYDQFDPTLLDEARQAAKPPWYRAYGLKNLGYVDVETEAAYVHEFALIELPGLLQTEAYMRALFAQTCGRSSQTLEKDIRVRLIRQERLTNDDRPLDLIAIVHEAALRNEIGGPEVMRGQLRHLVEMAEIPTVALHLIPQEGGGYRVPNGSFILLGFPDPEDPEYLYVEHTTGSLHIEESSQVRQTRLVFDQLRTSVLSPAESVALIERLIQ